MAKKKMKHPHAPKSAMPMPGKTEFDADEEKSMRQGMRADRGAPPTDGGEAEAPATSGTAAPAAAPGAAPSAAMDDAPDPAFG